MRLFVNTFKPRQNGRRFTDVTFIRILLNENVRVSIKIWLKFVPTGPINNIPALVQIMAWRRSGDKPFSETMMDRLPTHICVTRPQWVNVHGSIAFPVLYIIDVENPSPLLQRTRSIISISWPLKLVNIVFKGCPSHRLRYFIWMMKGICLNRCFD